MHIALIVRSNYSSNLLKTQSCLPGCQLNSNMSRAIGEMAFAQRHVHVQNMQTFFGIVLGGLAELLSTPFAELM